MNPNRIPGRHHPGHHIHHDHGDELGGSGPQPGRRRGRGRVPRGDVRLAVLLLLAEEPMHGYQIIQAISDRSGGRWTPSPGAIYPTISQLEDEGLVAVNAEAGRKLATLTEAGRQLVDAERQARPDPFAGNGRPESGINLRGLLEALHGAAREVGRNGSDAQLATAADILTEARRALYLLLAQEPEPTDTPTG